VDVQTGQSRLLYKGDAVQPEWSPHGLRVAYWATNSPDRNRSYRDIWTIPASGGTAVSVTNDAAVDWNPIWAPDGACLYFASDRGGSMNLWRVAIDEQTGLARGEPEALTAPTRFAGNISVSADGSRLAFASFDQARNIQAIEFDAAGERTRGEPRDVTSGSNSWGAPSVSPDGAWLAFNSLPPPRYDIFVSRTDGTGQLQLTNDGVNLLPVWSPDGARIAFYSSRSGHNQVWTVKPDGSQLKQLTSFDDPVIQPTWSPDGLRIAVSTGNPTGSRVYVFDPRKALNEQTPEALPPPPKDWLFQPRDWSPDGSRIAGYTLTESADMLVYSVASRSYRRIGTGPFGFAKWLRDSRRILYGGTGGTFSRGPGALSLVDTQTARTREILSLPHAQIVAFTISADNRTIYFARDSVEGDIWLATFQRGTTAALPSLR
jgi:Tol biopolymer transport system component